MKTIFGEMAEEQYKAFKAEHVKRFEQHEQEKEKWSNMSEEERLEYLENGGNIPL